MVCRQRHGAYGGKRSATEGAPLWTHDAAGSGRAAGRLFPQVLLLAVLGGTVGLGVTGWAIGLICGIIMNAALAGGLSRHGSNRLRAADWVTFARASLAVGVAGLVADSFARRN